MNFHFCAGPIPVHNEYDVIIFKLNFNQYLLAKKERRNLFAFKTHFKTSVRRGLRLWNSQKPKLQSRSRSRSVSTAKTNAFSHSHHQNPPIYLQRSWFNCMSASTESSLLYTHCRGQTSSCKSLTHSPHFFVSFPFSLSLLICYFNWAGSWFHTLSFVPPQTWLLLWEIEVRWCAWRCHQVQSASRCVCVLLFLFEFLFTS